MIRMKKVISIGTVLVMLLSLCSCGRTEKATSSDEYVAHSTTETSSDADDDSSQTTETAGQSDEDASSNFEDLSAPVVFFTSDISAEGLARLYEKLIWEPIGNLAVKVSTGEPPASNYPRQELIGELVQSLNGLAKQVADDHGFSPFVLLDENGSMTLPVREYNRISENYVGAAMADFDSMLVLSHFKGHAMAGFGGAIKNISVLMAAAIGVPLYACGGGTIPLIKQWLLDGMSLGSASAFMITGPATKITNLGALKIVFGIKRFLLYIAFVMMFSFVAGIVVNFVV